MAEHPCLSHLYCHLLLSCDKMWHLRDCFLAYFLWQMWHSKGFEVEGWIGTDWTGPGWVELGGLIGTDWIGLGWVETWGLIGTDWISLGWVETWGLIGTDWTFWGWVGTHLSLSSFVVVNIDCSIWILGGMNTTSSSFGFSSERIERLKFKEQFLWKIQKTTKTLHRSIHF